jgi:hypothetical protein
MHAPLRSWETWPRLNSPALARCKYVSFPKTRYTPFYQKLYMHFESFQFYKQLRVQLDQMTLVHTVSNGDRFIQPYQTLHAATSFHCKGKSKWPLPRHACTAPWSKGQMP